MTWAMRVKRDLTQPPIAIVQTPVCAHHRPGTRMPRLILPLAFVLAIGAGCSGNSTDSNDRPSADWAMALCKRVLKDKVTGDNPALELLRARLVTKAEAKALDDGFLPEGGGVKPFKYAASCKARFLDPRITKPDRKDWALLVFPGGSSTFVIDPYWAK